MFEKLFESNNYKNISGLTTELKAIYVYNKYINSSKPVLLVTNTLYQANDLYNRIKNYTDNVLFFPMDNFLTSEALAISPDLENNRLNTINELINNNNKIVVTNLMGMLRYIPKKETYKEKIVKLKQNATYKNLASDLIEIGYKKETIVTKTGEIALRGFVLDIFPINAENPIRIEFFGDDIEKLKEFDVETQLTKKEIKEVEIVPVKENIDKNYESIIDYLDNEIIIYSEPNEIKEAYKELEKEIKEYNESLNVNKKYMFDLNEIKVKEIINVNRFDDIDSDKKYASYEISNFPKKLLDINKELNKYLKENTVIVCLNNKYHINKIIDNIENNNFVITNESEIFENKINLIIKNINEGFIFNNYVVLSEKEVFNRNETKVKYVNKFKYSGKIKDITKLEIGDYVVHATHGIGRYLGIKSLSKDNLIKDYLVIEYAGNDKLYIPANKIEFIFKYSSKNDEAPKLSRLGGVEWSKTKKRIEKKLESIAADLLKLYAEREASKGIAFKKDDEYQINFEKEFIYEDTIDQRRVTEEIKRDMESIRPMDRLLCGDVGYGKTEVAFRAMFKAVYSGKQVAYLCPTTILSSQHYNNAKERFKDYPINIACLNRFITKKEVNRILSDLKEGKIDIVIGTHRLLSDDVMFKDLGLLVIDEEQRFGVKHKEKIKMLKNNIDVLTLSATPIPRTLQMSMMGIRNLSLLETPPVNRYPIQTYVLNENNSVIKEAVYKEIARNGQVFILYNSIENLEIKKREIQNLVPEAKIECAHGKMNKNDLEKVMYDFVNNEFNVLLCTTIIETGIDIPNVNTLIIIDADRFGLSQLYQIRGRVGRGSNIAYCYLMYKKGKSITDVAEKRLNAIREFTELGSGFKIAMRDLSIRGAGDILGSEQAGFIDSVGIDLYLKMLQNEIKKLKGEIIEEEKDEQPLVNVSTTISDNYVQDEDLKIEIHKMINEIDSFEKLKEVKNIIIDRFGKYDENIEIYMYEELFESKVKNIGIERINQTKTFIEIVLSKELTSTIDGQKLFFNISDLSKMFRIKLKNDRIIIVLDIVKLDKHYIYYLVDLIDIIKKSRI